MKYYAALIAALLLNATANLLMKFGIRRMGEGLLEDGILQVIPKILGNYVLMIGLFCFAANVLLYLYALQKFQISVAYPIMVTSGFAIIVIVSGLYLQERLTFVQWLGVALILIGVFLVASRAERQLGGPSPPEKVAESISPAQD
jgi:small multidrug resistance pump